MSVIQIINTMKSFGYSELETKVYMATLESGPMTGYEISKTSGVSRSKVYQVIESLLNKGILFVNSTERKLYSAISVDEFMNRTREKIESDLDAINIELSSIKEKKTDQLLWKMDRYSDVMYKARYLIKNAKKSVLLQVWEEDLTENFIQALIEAEQRLDQFVLILFSREHHYDLPLKRYYRHGYEEEKLKEMGRAWINLVVDEETVLYGSVSGEIDCIWSHNEMMVALAKEYIRHDAYTLKIIDLMSPQLKEVFGEQLNDIRDIY